VARNLHSIPYKSHLYSSINKYGVENFIFEIIEECEYDVLDDRERYWINKLNTLEPYGYNIKNGGSKLYGKDNPFFGKHHSEKTKNKISEKNTGRRANDKEREMRRKINKGNNNPFYGRNHTDKTKQKIKTTNIERGNYAKASERMRLHNPNDGSFFRKAVIMLSKTFDILNVFISAVEAGEYIKTKGISKAKIPSNSISDVCRGNQKSAYGFYWDYIKATLKCNLNTKTSGYIITKKN
jgi:group I intron endonuclease